MRKITENAVSAFFEARPFKNGNTKVEVLPNVTTMKLFGNAIAHRYNDPERTVSITTCGWKTNTTKERLNGILDYLGANKIYQKNHILYLGENVWDGKLIDIKT